MSNLSVHSAAQNRDCLNLTAYAILNLPEQLSLLKALVEENASLINAKDVDGRTPLHWAAFSGAADVASYLIDHKADVNAQDESGWTPLHIAASAGQEAIVRELLGAGADIAKTNDKGMTALHYAASKSQIEIGKLLIERGANINARDRANQLPLHRAATTGSTGFVALLLNPPEGSAKPRLNTGDRIGNTPLHLALESGHAEVAVKLIEAGADRDRTNSDGETPEQLEGVGGQEQRRVREYVRDRCGPPPS